MSLLSTILIALLAVLHIYILYMEMFAWTTIGRRTFGKGKTKAFFEETKSMASNQGLYNGFLAAGFAWSLFISNAEWQINVAIFFCICVAVAGLWGAYTEDKKIIVFQTVPATIALISLLV